MEVVTASLGELVVSVGANITGFKDAMTEVSAGLLDFEGAAEQVLGRITETLAFSELAKSAFDASQEIEEAMDNIAKVTGATGDKLGGLAGTFRSVFGDSVQSADDLSGALAILAQRSGATGDDLTSLTEINSKFAQVTDQQLKPAVEATQRLFQSWGIDIKDQSDKLDALVAVSQKTATSMATLTSNLQGSGAVLRTMGVDFDTAAALMANFNAKGLDVERVAASLKIGLTALAKEGFRDPEQAMGALIQQLIDAKSPMEALTIASQDFGKRGALYIVDAARQGGFAIGDLKAAADNARGTIARTADETESFGEKMAKLGNEVKLALEPMGRPMLDAMTGLAMGAQGSALGFKDMAEAIGGLIPDFVKMALSGQSMVGLGTAIGFVAAAVAAVAESAHSAALLLTDLAKGTLTGDFSQLAKDWEAHGIAMNKAWVTNFQEIAAKGDAAREKLDHLFLNSQEGAQAAGLAAFGLGKEIGNVGTSSAGAGEKVTTLAQALKDAETNLSEVEKAVRMGIGTDEDAAAARMKVVAAMQAMHPEFKNIFAETDSWNSIMKISTDFIGEQDAALLKLAPTVSAHTALLEAQAISLESRAKLWPIDMKNLQDEAAALTHSTDALKPNVASMKDLDGILKLVDGSLKDEEKTIQQNTRAYGPLHDAWLLGINDGSLLYERMLETHDAFIRATSAVDDHGRAIYSLHQQQIAEIADLTDQIRYYQSLGENTDELQLKVIHLTDAIRTQNIGFTDTVVAIHNIVGAGLDTVLNDLITGSGNVGDAFKKMADSIVTTFADRILKDALKPVLDGLDGVIDKALKAAAKLAGIGVNSIPVPGTTPGLPSGVYQPTISDIPQIPGPAGEGIPGVGGAPGVDTGAGGIGSVASAGVTQIVGAVAGVASAITGVIGVFQSMHQETSLNAIESNTRVGALYTLAILQESQGFRDFYNNALYPKLTELTTSVEETLTSVAALPGQIATAFGSGLGASLDAIKNALSVGVTTEHSDLSAIQNSMNLLAVSLKPGATVASGALSSAAPSGQQIVFNIYGATDPAAVTDSIAAYLKTVSPAFA